MGDKRPSTRNIQSDAPRPEDVEPSPGGFGEADPAAIAEREDMSYERRLEILQHMLAESPRNPADEAGLSRRRRIMLALQVLGAEVVADEDEPGEAPKKFGYRPTEEGKK